MQAYVQRFQDNWSRLNLKIIWNKVRFWKKSFETESAAGIFNVLARFSF